jgi:hypothetical protein
MKIHFDIYVSTVGSSMISVVITLLLLGLRKHTEFLLVLRKIYSLPHRVAYRYVLSERLPQ